MDFDVGNDIPEKIVMGIAGSEMLSLMQEVELVNDLYSQNYAVDKGRMTNAAGIDLIPFAGNVAKPILPLNSAGSVRNCFAMSTRGVCVGLSKELALKVEPRPDLIEVTQVQDRGSTSEPSAPRASSSSRSTPRPPDRDGGDCPASRL